MDFESCVQSLIKNTSIACWEPSRESTSNYSHRISELANHLKEGIQECADRFGLDRGGFFKDTSFNFQQSRVAQIFADRVRYCSPSSVNSTETSSVRENRIANLRNDFWDRYLDTEDIKEILISTAGLVLGLIALGMNNAEVMREIPISPTLLPSLTVLTGIASLAVFFYPDIRRGQVNHAKHYPSLSNHNAIEFAMLSGFALGSAALFYHRNLLNFLVPDSLDRFALKCGVWAVSSLVLGLCAYGVHHYVYRNNE